MSQPSHQMLAAMNDAAGEPASFDRDDQGSVRILERMVADCLARDDALFCPTCTMCNQIAINVLTSPGDTLLCESASHIVTSEAGAPAALSGVSVRGIDGDRGLLSAAAVKAALDRPVKPASIVVENTHTRSGGRALPEATMATIGDVADAAGVAIHLDGARLFNAAVALGVSAERLARRATSIALSLNKGLGAPLGAVLVGDRDMIREAVAVRRRLGGEWRLAAIPAAAGIVALRQGPEQLADDHARARLLADRLSACGFIEVLNAPVETNLVLARVAPALGTAEELVAFLTANGVGALEYDGAVRFALHNGICEANVRRAADVVDQFGARNRAAIGVA